MKLEGRFSLDKHDPGYATLTASGHKPFELIVTLNGERVYAITADTERGEILIQCRDKDDHPIVEGDAVKTEWLYGKVEITIPKDGPKIGR